MSPWDIRWRRLALARLALGLAGVLAGLALGAVFLCIWHWVWLIVVWAFGGDLHWLVYAMDALFVVLLLWEGRRYKARMPPPNPFTRTETMAAIVVSGHAPFTPSQATFAISEILCVAPRFLFWGLRHLRCIALPSGERAEDAMRLHQALWSRPGWTPFSELANSAGSPPRTPAALALLVRVGLAEGGVHDQTLRFRASRPKWL